ncbi:MAG: universal stress protein [Actinomycetota bacterium]|nr:universal stress protein [Actinomycetota bacterium]
MYRKVIVGFIDSDEGRDAVALGALIARAAGSPLVLTGVFPAGPPQELIGDGVNKILEERELALGRKLQDAADAAGAEAEPFPSNSRARGLHDAATELEADLVVVGSSSRAGLGRVLAGNVALQLLHGSPCAVAVAPRGFARSEPHLAVIGVGIDGSDESTEALHPRRPRASGRRRCMRGSGANPSPGRSKAIPRNPRAPSSSTTLR